MPSRTNGLHPKAANGLTYTIDDVGAPPSGRYGSSLPVAFNNTGQIFGTAFDSAKRTNDCVVYNAGRFVDVSLTATDESCNAGGINSATAGVTEFVGSFTTPFEQSSIAFFGTMQTSTGQQQVYPFKGNAPSALFGVNSSGEAVGYAWYAPQGGFYLQEPYFVMPAPHSPLAVMQPQCTRSGQPLCAWSDYVATQGCAFGGCTINDSGMTLGWDPYDATSPMMTYLYGDPSSATDIPLAGQISDEALALLNNAGQVAYSGYNATSGNTTAYVYASATQTTQTIPTFPGNSCKSYLVGSLNNAGEVFGETNNCANFSDFTYWTWDPVNGLQDLSSEIPNNGYYYITPLGINDNGQILAELVTTKNVVHWGTLDPPVAVKSRARRPPGAPARR